MKTEGPLDPAALARVAAVHSPSLSRVTEDGLEKQVIPPLKTFNAQLEEVNLDEEAETALRRRTPIPDDEDNSSPDQIEVSDEGLLLGRVIQRIHPKQLVQLNLFSTDLGLLGEAQEEGRSQGENPLQARRHPLMEALGIKDTQSVDLASRVGLLAKQIAQAVEKSGLFYESHLRQWKEGKRSKVDLLDEPQSDWPRSAVLGREGGDSQVAEQARASILANQQLNLLVNPRLQLLLPGLQGESIRIVLQHSADEGAPEDDGSQQERRSNSDLIQSRSSSWSFELSMQLHKLGRVHAGLHITGTQAEKFLKLEVESIHLDQFRQYSQDLKDALQLSGLSIDPLRDETA